MLRDALPTLEEILALDLAGPMARARQQECWAYAVELHLVHPRQLGDPLRPAHVLVAFVLALGLNPDSDANPLTASTLVAELGPQDLSDEQRSVLGEWRPHIDDPEIAARVADLMWLARRRRDRRDGEAAIAHYCASATRLAGVQGGWRAALDRFERALVLARKFEPEVVESVATQIESLLDDGSGTVRGPRDARMILLLIEHYPSAAERYLEIATARADVLEIQGATEGWAQASVTLEIAREFWRASERCRARVHGGGSEQVREARRRIGHTYILEATLARVAGQPWVEAHHLSTAITMLRQVGDDPALLDELTGRMMEAQRGAPVADISTTINVTEVVRKGQAFVGGLELPEALQRLAFIVDVPTIAQLRAMADDHFQHSAMSRLLATTITTSDQRIIATFPAPDDGSESDPAIRWQMYSSATGLRGVLWAVVHGARQQLLLEHQPRLADFAGLVHRSWLVPPGHEGLWARGLHAGLYGDFTAACHILVPQLENGLRSFVEHGLRIPMVSLRNDGAQTVRMLDRVLSQPQLVAVLGEDIVFDLQGLLVRQEGANLRNDLAHGIVGDLDFRSCTPAYTWWLCLRLCFTLIQRPTGPAAADGNQPAAKQKPAKQKPARKKPATKKPATREKVAKKRSAAKKRSPLRRSPLRRSVRPTGDPGE